jgi:cell division protein FtsB
MHVNLGIWSKLTRVAVFLCFVALILLVGAWYLPLVQQNERMRRRILGLDVQIQKAEETHKQLKAAIDALCYDAKSVERLARERLGYVKPGETVIRFEQPPTNPPAPR